MWISPSPGAKLQATGVDAAGRRQYLYHPAYRAAREQEKFDRLVRFGELLPGLRKRMALDVDRGPYEHDWTCAIAVALVNRGWFRVGSDRYARTGRTYGITTLTKRHSPCEGPNRLPLPRQARCPGTDDTRRRGARRRRSRAAALRRRGAAAALRARRAAREPDGAGAQPLHRRAPRRRLHGERLPHVGRHAHSGRAARRARPARVGRRGVARPRCGHAKRRRRARQYSDSRAHLVRQPGGDRPVAGRAYARGLRGGPSTSPVHARHRASTRGGRPARPASLMADPPRARRAGVT